MGNGNNDMSMPAEMSNCSLMVSVYVTHTCTLGNTSTGTYHTNKNTHAAKCAGAVRDPNFPKHICARTQIQWKPAVREHTHKYCNFISAPSLIYT